jgi:hypothetical protein
MFIPDQKELTQALRAGAVAEFLLDVATAWNVRVGYVGDEIVTISTTKVPLETICWLEAELVKNKRAVIAAIQAARTGATS